MAEKAHELVPFLAIHADRYQRDNELNGLHPVHYDLMVKYGARMDSFQRATNAPEAGQRRCEGCDGHECDGGCAYPGAARDHHRQAKDTP
jgi:hypothetical protein